MTLQASGAISFEDLKNEFGDGTGSVSFERYYKGTEGEVPPNSFGNYTPNVPTSGSGTAISLSNFYSAQNVWETTITSTGFDSSKILSRYGYDVAIGEIGTNGDYLYNLSGNLVALTVNAGGTNITLAVGNTGIDATAWTTVSFIRDFVEYKYTRAAATTAEENNQTLFSWNPTSTGPFAPEGSKVKVLFFNNG